MGDKMKITFIRPSMAGEQSADALPPLAFMILSSLTPSCVDIEFFDERIEDLPLAIDSDVVCFSVEVFSAKRASLLASKYKKQNPGIKIIMGGFYPTACPDEAKEFADSIIIGDAEPVWEQVIKDLENNELKGQYVSSNSYMLPFSKMDKSIFANKNYFKIGVVQWKRGCAFNCNFCSIHSFYKSCILEREIDDVIEEIKHMKEKVIFITDDNLLHDKVKMKEFLGKLTPLKKKWACQVSINVTNDDELLGLMAKSGCIVMLIGFESLNKENLMEIGKKQNIACNDYESAIKSIYSHGIMIYATFIFGYPHDNLESFDEVYEFAMKHKFLIANFNPLMAMPSTDLYDELKAKGELVNEKWWISEEYCYGDAMHYPKNFSSEQLAASCKRLRYKFYSKQSIFKRMWNLVNLRYLPIFLLINIVLAVEIKRKQRVKLGGQVT
ncbi:MAG: B12-binding domain-containing radical SAM protein [Synergistaceae bacterium]|nr:B12-binding domain-containing radical SAM protein [Synergistaceae bacterium]